MIIATCKDKKVDLHHQRELEESRGQLLRVHEAEGQCIAVFPWGAVSLPGELEPKLREMIGREVACLRLDGKFHIREVVGRG